MIRQYFWSYISAGTSAPLRTFVQPLSFFLRASEPPSAASNLPFVEATTLVRFLTPLYWVLSLSYIFAHRGQLFFILRCHLFFFINSCAFQTLFHFSYLMMPLCESPLILLLVVHPPVVVRSVVL